MKSLTRLFAAVALLILPCVASADNTNRSFIHYTSDTLDARTAARRQLTIQENNRAAGIEKEKMGRYGYDDYSGKHPEFSAENRLDSIVDARGFKTMVMTRPANDYNCIVIYIHGGAFTYNFVTEHRDFCEALLKSLNAKVYMPLYPLAPNYTVSDTFGMLLDIYRQALSEGKPIYIMGDSAGGNITLCFSAYLHRLGLTMPSAIMPISPACDYTMSNPDLWEANKTDIVLGPSLLKGMTTIWADKGMSPTDPMINPLSIDAATLPPTLFFIGTGDSFYPDCQKMYGKLTAAGVRTGMLVGKGLWHVSVAADIPARQQFIGEILDFVK